MLRPDPRLTNLLLHKGETRVIDFDDCGMGWYLHDLTAAISFVEHHPRAAEWVDKWILDYESVAHISDAEMALSLGPHWASHSVRLCRRYLESSQQPAAGGRVTCTSRGQRRGMMA